MVPSYREGLPNIILEAMACGCVVAATAVGGIPDVVVDGHTGFILSDNSPDTIARELAEMMHNDALLNISENAVELIAGEYIFKATVERYSRILNAKRLEQS